MTKKLGTSLAGLLVLAAIISACSAPPMAGGTHQEAAPAEPLDMEEWPTPALTPEKPTPTPFPKVTLVPTPTRTPLPQDSPAAASDAEQAAAELGYGGDINELAEQVTALSGGLEPVAGFMVTDPGSPIRQGPGESYASVMPVEMSELGAVLGTDNSRGWLYVYTISGGQGWLPAANVRVLGSVDAAPVLPANPLAAVATNTGGEQSGQAVSAPARVQDLEATAAARVNTEQLNMRQGPGVAYGMLGSLGMDETVSVLALNKSQDWALVETPDQAMGWVSIDYLELDGSLEEVPTVLSARPETNIPDGSLAPLAGFQQQPAPATVPTQNTEPETQVAQSPVQNPKSEIQNLSPVASAQPVQGQVQLYRGPGRSYEPIVEMQVEDRLSILAVDKSGDWALVNFANGAQSPGWVRLADVTVNSSVQDAAQAITAWVESGGVNVRLGPGIYYQEIGALKQDDMVLVLGLNSEENWALVRPVTGGDPAWVPVYYLYATGPLSDVAHVSDTVLTETSPAEQTASTTAPAPIQNPGVGKLVVQLASGGDIMLMNQDGTDLHILTKGIDPVLSPDGQQLAFTRWSGDGADSGLWVMNTDGSGERLVLGEMRKAKGPDWSPDGERIVLNFQDGGRLDPKRNCVNLVENQPSLGWNAYDVEVTTGDDGMPYLCWKLPPDAYWSLRLVDLADGAYRDIYGGSYGFRPAWDPTQDWRVVADSGNGLIQTDVDQDISQGLTDRWGDGSPVISPDGRYIAIVNSENNSYDIERLNADGSGRLRLTQTPIWVTGQPGEGQNWRNVAPAWSPDGSQIAFLTDRTGRWEIWLMNVDGSNQHPMFSDEINDQLDIVYDLNDERVISWR